MTTKNRNPRLEDLPARYQNQALMQGAQPAGTLGKLVRSGNRKIKHGNIRCTDAAGRVFDSKKEMADFEKLVMAYGIQNVIRQVSIPLDDRPPVQRIRPDFVVIRAITEDGLALVEFLDSKGHATADWKRKAKAFLMRHGIEVKTI